MTEDDKALFQTLLLSDYGLNDNDKNKLLKLFLELEEENAELKAQNENKREEIKMLRNEHKQDMAIHNNYVNKVEKLEAQIEKMKNRLNCTKYHYCLCKDENCKDCKDWRLEE